MAEALVERGWLIYRRLDFSPHIDGAFAIGHRILNRPDERWSRRFLRFKNGI